MSKTKYQAVLDLGEKLKIQDGDVQEKDGKLFVKGKAASQYEKDLLWDKIKAIGGDNPSDIVADISVASTAYYHKHMIVSGDTLSKISKMYYKDGNKYMKIFEANKHLLINPDTLQVGVELTIPNP